MGTDLLKPDDTIRPLVHTLRIGIFQCEPNTYGKFTFMNLMGAEILGYASPREILGVPLRDHFVNHVDYNEWFARLKDTGIQIEYEALCKRKDGKTFAIGVTSCLVLDPMGKRVRIDGVIQDLRLARKMHLVEEVIANINKILVSNLNIREVDHLICDEIYKVIEWDRVSIALIEDIGDVVVDFAITRGQNRHVEQPKTLAEKCHYPLFGSIVERVASTGKPVIVRDTTTGEFDTDNTLLREGIRSRLAYPLKFKGKVIGSINFGCFKVDYYSAEHISLLEKIAPSIAFGIENTKLYERAVRAEKEYKDLSKTFDSPWM